MAHPGDEDRRPTILVASTAVTAHSLNATPFVRSLSTTGARVVWYAAPSLHAHAARFVGADFVAFPDDVPVLFSSRPPGRGTVSSLAEVRRMYRDHLAGSAARHAQRLLALIRRERVDVLISDTLMLGAGVAAEVAGVPWVTFGDGPLQWPDPDLPPFGTGLRVLHGAAGRHRNRHVKQAVDALLFSDALVALNRLRRDHGLWPVSDLLTAGVSRRLHLQGCTPGFEYPRARWPEFVRFVGALGPGPGFAPAVPDDLRRGVRTRPLALVTQGTMRPDPRELVLPAARTLAAVGFDVLVAGATGAAAPHQAGVRVMRSVDYPDALREADVFVTNGGYTGVTLALAAGTPVVQCGATEEKADIGARLRACGAGESIRLVTPPAWWLRRAVHRVLTEPGHRRAQRDLAAEFAAYDTDRLIREHVLGVLTPAR